MPKNRLKIVRKAKGKTQNEIAKVLNIAQNTYSYWENGNVKIDAESLSKLANYYGVSLDFLSGRNYTITNPYSNWRDDQKQDFDSEKDESVREFLYYKYGALSFENDAKIEVNDNKGVRIPIYGNVAAGIPIEAITDIEDYEEIPAEMARGGEYVALRIHGRSMEPRMLDGDVVIVRLQDDVDSGDIAIVFVNGCDATCKQVIKTADGLSLVSINPEYKPMPFTRQQVQDFPVRIWGKVVELRAKF